MLFYLLAYVFMNLGAFARGGRALANRGHDCDRFEDFAGLAQHSARASPR